MNTLGMYCVKCKEYKEPEDFYKRRKVCKKCIRFYIKSRLTPEKKQRNKNARKFRHTDFISKIKSETPCTDCGRKLPYWVMDFDHITDKSFQISRRHRTKGMESLVDELAKCNIVCSVCHRHRTYCRLNNIELYILEIGPSQKSPWKITN